MTRFLRDWLHAATDIRREEYLPAALMFVYGFLALTSYYIAKAVRNAVFVQRVGADNLDWIYILTAIFVTLVMVVYSRWVDRVEETTLLQGTFGALAVTMAGFAWLLGSQGGVVVSGAFYLFIKLYPLLLISQFWLVGNMLFSTRQAKRVFGPIGVGLIVGGITGGTVASQAASAVGSENLLYLAAGILLLCSAVVWMLTPHLRVREDVSARVVEDISGDALQLLKRSDHLRTIAWILGLTIVVSTVLDWELNKAVELHIASEDAMTAFWGDFFVLQNVVSVLVQLLFTGFILQKFGIGVAMLFLPVSLLVASAGIVVVPALLTAALAKGAEGALRYSLDQSTRELLYLPVPIDVKYKAKPLVDLAVYRMGTGVGGLSVMLFTDLLGFSFRGMAVVAMGIIVVWIGFTLRMRGEFRNSIKRLIGVRDLKLDELIVQRLDARTLDELQQTLREGSEEEVLYALTLLEHNLPERLVEDVRDVLHHRSDRARAQALELLDQVGAGGFVDDAYRLLYDPSMDVRVEAINYICRFSDRAPSEEMDAFLSEENHEVRSAAIACLLRHGNEEQVIMGRASARGLASAEPGFRQDAARILGELDELDPGSEEVLLDLLEDEVDDVRHEAMRAAGRTASRALVPVLLDALGRPQDRRAAREALQAYGSAIHDLVLEHLASADVPRGVRVQLPYLLLTAARQQDVDRMVALLGEIESETVRFHVLKCLNKLHRNQSRLDFSRYDLEPLVRREIRRGYRHAAFHHALSDGGGEGYGDAGGGGDGDAGAPLLLRTLEQRRREAVERALRTLGLQHPQEDLYVAFTALISPDRLMQHRGYELLDNVLPRRVREWFDPLANPEASWRRRARDARERFGVPRLDRERALDRLARGSDVWLSVLARLETGRDPFPSDESEADFRERLLADTLLRSRTSDSYREVPVMDIIERADFLRHTPIFSNLRTEDLAGLGALATERTYGQGDVLFPEGSAEAALYVVVEGTVEGRREGRRVLEAGPGDTLGELALLDGRPTHYAAVAGGGVTVLRIGREDFFNLLEDRFRVTREVLGHLAGMVRELAPEGSDEEAPAPA